MILAGLLGGAAKGIGRDLGMGFGVTERDQDYFDRTRETLRRQYGDDRATLYEQQTAAQRAAAPRGRVENPNRSEKGILSTIIGDLKLGLPNRDRSTRATSRGSGSDMSSSLRPRIDPRRSMIPQSADLMDFPLMNMQRGMSGLPNMSMPANAAYLPPLSSQLMKDPPMGITGAGDQIPVTSLGAIQEMPTFEAFLDALGVEDTLENRKIYAESYVEAMGGY